MMMAGLGVPRDRNQLDRSRRGYVQEQRGFGWFRDQQKQKEPTPDF